MRLSALGFIGALIIGCGGTPTGSANVSIAEHVASLSAAWSEGRTEVGPVLHRLRNAEAMTELVGSLPPSERPETILYLASGAHLAPLVVCEALPGGRPCRLIMTEIDAGVQNGIEAGLEELQNAGCLRGLKSGPAIEGSSGRRMWSADLVGGRPVTVELRVFDPRDDAPLVTAALADEADLVISHDWTGDPLGNLQVIRWFLGAARERAGSPPLLMIEDLRRHPYPVDLDVFSPVASTTKPYGHRESDAGPGRHGRVELGTPIFGGGVLLAFSDPWWRKLSTDQLEGSFDFLLLNEFDIDRQNVLEGGEDPLLAPMLLDWWTGFGARDIDGSRIVPGADGGTRKRAITAAIAARDVASPGIARIFSDRLRLYGVLLALRAQGVDTLDLMPAARFRRRPKPGAFPSEAMERLYRQALRHIDRMQAEREAFRPVAGELLEVIPERDRPAAADPNDLRRMYRFDSTFDE